ncbi:M4 family metallopeptidase [Reichenbachiella sp.]
MKRVLFTLLVTACVCYQGFAQDKSKTFIRLEASQGRMSKTELLRNQLRMSSSEEMKALKTEDDQLGYRHEKFEHFYKGIRVEGSTYTIHSKNGVATHMTGNYATIAEVDINPQITGANALSAAKSATEASEFAWEANDGRTQATQDKPEGELVIVQNTSNGYKARLAYKYHILGNKPFVNAYVYIDAKTGEVVRYNSVIKHADAVGSGATRYSGTQTINTDSNTGSYRLRDYSRGNGILTYDGTTATSANQTTGRPNGSSDYTDNNNSWTAGEYDNADKDNAALDAHFAAEATYDFFMSNFNRDSYDGNGASIESHVNTDIESVYGYPAGYNDNAFWTGYVMVYGKGNSLDPLTTVDITAHEIGHAFCTGTADLVYEKESGAMNEGLSDIWGACVEYYVNQNYGLNKDLWNLGTEIGQTFRSMSNPKAYGDPDTYGGTNWISQNCTPSSQNDYCGVHTNSGVTNHWFYVLVAGETDTNDNNDSYSVTGIGVDDAAAIVWRTESIYLNTNSDYADFRTYSIQSAVELFGSGSAQEIAVTNSWYAVGVGSEYVQTCSLAAPGNLTSSSINDNGFTLSWSAVSGAASYTVTVGGSSTNVSGTSHVATGLNTGTQYACSVVANCGSGGSGPSSNLNVTTTGTPPLNYCSSNGNSTSDEYIGRVQLNTIDNATGASSGGYGDYTTQSTSLTKGDAYTITITPTWSGTVYNEAYSVWIDYNQDGDFADAGEQVYSQAASQTSPVSGSFTVPTGATNGNTRMRVSMKYNGIPTSCESFQYGEVEDYTIHVVTGSADTEAPSAPTGLAASSITQTTLTLNWNASADNVGVTGYDVYQGATNIGTVTTNSANITGLTAATSYSFTVRAKDLAGNVSDASNAVNVTTQSAGMSCSSTTSIPYSEGFESGFGAWTNQSGDDLDWTRRTGSTPSSSTGPSSASEGSYYMYVEASSPNYPSKETRIESPCYDLSGESAANFSFKYHMYGTNMGTLTLEATTDGNNWSSVWSQSGNKGNSWLTADVNMDTYTGEVVKLRFVGVTGSSYRGDMAVDDIAFSAGSTGGTTNVTLTMTFDNYPEETSWSIMSGSTTIASGGTYASQADGSTLNVNVELADGCYSLVMNDAYGDGMCCSYGSGSYSLTDGSTTLASGGSFGSSETTPFCVGGASFTAYGFGGSSPSSVGTPVSVDMYPNPVVGYFLNIVTTRDEVSYRITNLMGKRISSGQLENSKVDVSTLKSGVYLLQLVDKGGKSVIKKFTKE